MKTIILFTILLSVLQLQAAKISVERLREKLRSFEVPQEVREDRAKFLKNWHQILKTTGRTSAESFSFNEGGFSPKIDDPTEIPFDCPYFPPSSAVPTSVHSLRPGDIDIVAALGDSISAGMGMRARSVENLWMTFIPNRGEVFSIGGERSLDEGVITITNLLRKFNHDVMGASYCARGIGHPYAGYNVAIPGDIARGMEAQAVNLINLLLDTLSIDEYFSSWKMITLFIGGNDLCQSCNFPPAVNISTPEGYTDGIKRALDLLHEWLPRAFVNLQIMADVSVVRDLRHPGFEERCDDLHEVECPCAMDEESHATLRPLQLAYYDKLMELVADDRYDTRNDFTVVIQPFLRDMEPFKNPDGSYDMSYFGPDCFHPSYKTHQIFAIGLWNCMLTPVGQKPVDFDEETSSYKCPSESEPFLYTSKNSPPSNI